MKNPKSDDNNFLLRAKAFCFGSVVLTSSDAFGELSGDGNVGVDGCRGILGDGCIDVQKVGLIGLIGKSTVQSL